MMKRNNYINFKKEDHFPLGASETIPNLTLPVHEMMEKLTDHTLDNIRAKSMLHGEYFPVGSDEDVLNFADKMCLADTCIDLTDVSRVKEELGRQINIMKENFKKNQSVSKPKPVENVKTPDKGVVIE